VDRPAVLRSLALPFAVLTALTLSSSNPAPWAPPVAVGYEELLSHGEVTLYYPGSRLMYFGGYGESPERCQSTLSLMCIPADRPAFIGTILIADADSAADIFLWYQEQLNRRGWRPGISNADVTRVYERAPGEAFQLVVQTPETSRSLVGGTGSHIYYQTTYFFGTCPSIHDGCRTNLAAAPPNGAGAFQFAGPIVAGDLTVLPDPHLFFPSSILMGSDAGHFSNHSGTRNRVFLVARAGSSGTVFDWYERTLTTSGWTNVSSMPSTFEFRRGSESLLVTITEGQSPLGYAVTGLAYTVLYSIDTCAGQSLSCG
jgi:hypothetical protein